MSSRYNAAFAQRLFAYDGEHESLASVVAVNFCAGLELHTDLILYKACRFGLRYGELHRLTLGACGIEKAHVLKAVILDGNALCGIDKVIAVFLLIE